MLVSTEKNKESNSFNRLVVIDSNFPYAVPKGHYAVIKAVTGASFCPLYVNGVGAVYVTYSTSLQGGGINAPFMVAAGDGLSINTDNCSAVVEEYKL